MSDDTQTQEPRIMLGLEGIKAVNVLIAAAGVAQQKGAFSLEDAKHVFEAVQTLAPREVKQPESDEEVKTEAS